MNTISCNAEDPGLLNSGKKKKILLQIFVFLVFLKSCEHTST